MRYALLILAALAIASPALAWNDPARTPDKQQGLDKVRATPDSSFPKPGMKDHIIDTIKKQCPGCS